MTLVQLRVVVAGLDPAIHVLATGTGDAGNRVDARVKPAHDDLQLVPIKTQQPTPVPRTAPRSHGTASPPLREVWPRGPEVPAQLALPDFLLRQRRCAGFRGFSMWKP
jgi:hypothetical protein